MEAKTNMQNLRVYMDTLGRLILGELVEEGKVILKVKNPLILHTQMQDGQISIQFYPIMFKEFQADKDEATIWEYNRSNITICNDIVIDARLISQYNNIFAPVKTMPNVGGQPPQPVQPAGAQNTIKLFDDKVKA
jgi:hypothetical protein